MSFREKCAWISFSLLVLLATGFALGGHLHMDGIDGLHYFLALILGFALLQVALRVIVARQAPTDARSPKDERDQLIDLKAARIGFYSLVAGVLLSMLLVHAHGNPWTGLESMVLAVLVAWAIKFASEIVYYRRGR
jgi:cytochrome b561